MAAILISLPLLMLLFYDRAAIPRIMLSICFPIFLSISLYYALLLPALPLLRRRISARTCAALWLLPNYLYYTVYTYMELPEPDGCCPCRSPCSGGRVWAVGSAPCWAGNHRAPGLSPYPAERRLAGGRPGVADPVAGGTAKRRLP